MFYLKFKIPFGCEKKSQLLVEVNIQLRFIRILESK